MTTFTGIPDADDFTGGSGDDLFVMGPNLSAHDHLDGGAGNDTVTVSGPLDLTLLPTTLVSIENLILAAGSSYRLGLDAATVPLGYAMTVDGSALGVNDSSLALDGSTVAGELSVTGGAADDQITAGAGSATLNGGAGDDVLTFGNYGGTFQGGDGNDEIIAPEGRVTGDGGAGIDRVIASMVGGLQALTYSGTTLIIGGNSISNVEAVTITGTTADQYFFFSQAVTPDFVPSYLDGGGGDDVFEIFMGSQGPEEAIFCDGANGSYTVTDSRGNLLLSVTNAWQMEIDGGGGDDHLSNAIRMDGNGGDDVLTVGLGQSQCSGGDGNDTVILPGRYQDYSFASDTQGRILVTGPGISSRLDGIELLRFSNAMGTVTGTTVSFTEAPIQHDFNQDGRDDILLRADSGRIVLWDMDATTRLAGSGKTSSTPDANYTVVGTGDFNGDGKTDILMQDQNTGRTIIWLMDGATRLAASGEAGSNRGAAYKALGAADFNGDGKSDILWQNTTTGQVSVWLMNGTTKLAGANVGAPLGADWSSAGTGDFDGDGKADIVFQNVSTGAVKIWLMDGATKVGGGALAATSGADNQIVGIGDFNGDGKADLLWENTATTALSIWFMDGMTCTNRDSIGDAGAGRVVVGTGDYNGDGKADILLQTTSSGHLTEWLMDGSIKLPGSGSVSANPGTDWHLVSG